MRNVGGFIGVAFFVLRLFVGGLRLGGFDGRLGWLVALLRVLRFFLRLIRLRFVVLLFLLLRLVLFERLLVIPRRERRGDVLAQRHADERVAVHVGPRVVEVAVERVEIPFAAVKKIIPRRVEHRLVVIVIRARHLMPFARLHIVNHDGVELAVRVASVGEPAAVAAPVHFESIELAVIHPQLSVNLLRLLRVEIVQPDFHRAVYEHELAAVRRPMRLIAPAGAERRDLFLLALAVGGTERQLILAAAV